MNESMIHYYIKKLKQSNNKFGYFNLEEEFSFYIKYYQLPPRFFVDYIYGFLWFNNKKIWCIFVMPKKEIFSTVVFVHGYQSHSGDQKNIIFDCVYKNKAILLFDLPGHGLSDGQESYIEDFDDYLDCFNFVMYSISSFFVGNLELFGHSQGCAIISKYVIDKKNLNLTYFAPMNRLWFWHRVRAISFLPIRKIRGIKANVSSDREYNKFAKNDPMQSKTITISWFRAAIKIHEELMLIDCFDDSINLKIIQGDKDRVVDWEFNIFYFASRFKDVTIRIIKDGNHQLQNESYELRKRIFL